MRSDRILFRSLVILMIFPLFITNYSNVIAISRNNISEGKQKTDKLETEERLFSNNGPDAVDDLSVNSIGKYGTNYINSISFENDLGVVCLNGRIELLDVSNPSSITSIIGQYRDGDTYCNYAFLNESRVYLENAYGGMSVLDVRNPNNINRTDYLDDVGGVTDIVEKSSKLYIATNWSEVSIYSNTDPSHPSELGEFHYYSGISQIDVLGDYIFSVSGSNELLVIDATIPTTPTLGMTMPITGTASSVAISSHYLYISNSEETTDHGLYVYDISNPLAPIYLHSLDLPAAQEVIVVDDVAYLFSDRVYILDISNPGNPTRVFSFETGLKIAAIPDRLFILRERQSELYGIYNLEIYSTSTPYFSYKMGDYHYLTGAFSVAISNDIMLLTAMDNGLQLVDISNKSAPSSLGWIDTPGRASDVAVSGDLAYVADTDSLRVYDISDPRQPNYLSRYSSSGVSKVKIRGNYAYISSSSQLKILNISNPTNIYLVGSINLPSGIWDFKVSGEFVYIADGEDGFFVVDTSNRTSPQIVGEYPTAYYAGSVGVEGQFVYLADITPDVVDMYLRVLSVSDPTNPQQIGQYHPSYSSYTGIEVQNQLVYASDYFGGIKVLNASNPTSINEVGNASTCAVCWDIELENGYIYSVGYGGAEISEFTGNIFNYSLLQSGPIQIIGDLVEGEKVTLRIPVTNYGSASSSPIHIYSEGRTALGSLWRANDTEPSSVEIQPGETVVFELRHDLWYEHVGTWNTESIYIWDNEHDSFIGELNSNGYDQSVEFEVISSELQGLVVQYFDSNRAVDISYEIVRQETDGSITVNLYLTNRTFIPYTWDTISIGGADTPTGKINRLENATTMVLLPKTTAIFANLNFPSGSSVEFLFPKWGYNDDDQVILGFIHALTIASAGVNGSLITGDMVKGYAELSEGGINLDVISDGLDLISLATSNIALDLIALLGDIARRDFVSAANTMSDIAGDLVEVLADGSVGILKSPVNRTALGGFFEFVGLITHLYYLPSYIHDAISAPGYAEITIYPTTRPVLDGGALQKNVILNPYSPKNIESDQIISIAITDLVVSSEHEANQNLEYIIDGENNTGWTTGGETPKGEWIELRTANNTPALITEVQINPGPSSGEHIDSALREFRVEISADSVNFVNVLEGEFLADELGQMKSFPIIPTIGEYVRITVISNQSNNAINYGNIADVALEGTLFASSDNYEPDSEIFLAMGADTFGSIYEHNFSHPDDIDWRVFRAETGITYYLYADPLNVEDSLKVEIYDNSGGTIYLSAEASLGQIAELVWEPISEGDYYVKLFRTNDLEFNPTGEWYRFSITNSEMELSDGFMNYLPLMIQH